MQTKTIAIAAALAFGMMGSGAALAQNAVPLPSTVGAMTCADFTQMSASAQENLLPQANADSSITSNSGTNASAQGDNGTAAVAPMLNAGQLVAACQAASPTSTVDDAYSRFSTGTTGTTMGK